MPAANIHKYHLATVACAALAGTLLAGCFGSSSGGGGATEPVVDYFAGAPEGIVWGDPVTVTAFAPAQRSWEWVVREAGDQDTWHSGARVNQIRFSAASCTSCHGSSAPGPAELGNLLVGADADPIPGKVGFRDITVQAAYTNDKFFLKASWETQQLRPGASHDLLTLKEGVWVTTGFEKPNELVDATYDLYSAEDRISVMLLPTTTELLVEPNYWVETSGGQILESQASFHTVGCWATCHDDQAHMPGDTGASKYLLDVADRAAGEFLDMWHFRGGRSAAVQSLTDGYVLASRAGDSGSDVFSTNALDLEGNPTWMYDAAIMGFNALPRDAWWNNLENAPPLIIAGPNMNAAPFDPTVAFDDGAIIPRRVLVPVEAFADVDPPKTEGSRTDVKAYSKWTEDGTWTVIFERDLDTGDLEGDHFIALDVPYTIAFAVHDDHAAGRWHHVSFPVTLGSDATGATIKAKLNP
ncbi:MAG TPA: hypothetical protein ENN42_09670 [Thioalkalivibrio sp.]|nr:hypothetical protein [Thioalkalivibrio sp.]